MLDRLLANLSLRRSVAGLYYELRTLRQMLEIVLSAHGYELPRSRKADSQDTSSGEQFVDPPSEEQLAQQAADQIMRDRLAGKNAGTTWVEDPNR